MFYCKKLCSMSQKETSNFMPFSSIPSSPLPPDFFAPGAQIEKLRYATYRIYSSLDLARGKRHYAEFLNSDGNLFFSFRASFSGKG